MKLRTFLVTLLALLTAPFVRKSKAEPTLDRPILQTKRIERHPAFKELRVKYEWDDATDKFPTYLIDGRLNPLCGVTGFIALEWLGEDFAMPETEPTQQPQQEQ